MKKLLCLPLKALIVMLMVAGLVTMITGTGLATVKKQTDGTPIFAADASTFNPAVDSFTDLAFTGINGEQNSADAVIAMNQCTDGVWQMNRAEEAKVSAIISDDVERSPAYRAGEEALTTANIIGDENIGNAGTKKNVDTVSIKMATATGGQQGAIILKIPQAASSALAIS